MIYLVMCGRLGNQLFQYSFARRIQMETGQDLSIDFTAVDNIKDSCWEDYLKYYNAASYHTVKNSEYHVIQKIIFRLLRKIITSKKKRDCTI